MDPNACYKKWINNAVTANDRDASPVDRKEALDTAIEAAQDLTDWIGKGGFAPDVVGAELDAFYSWCDDYLNQDLYAND